MEQLSSSQVSIDARTNVSNDSILERIRGFIVSYGPNLNYVILILISVSGITPVAIFGEKLDLGDGSGDTLRQICFLGVFTSICCTMYFKLGVKYLLRVPVGLGILLLWLWLSLFWAIDPGIALRRVAFASIVALAVLYGTRCLSEKKVISAIFWTFTFILFVDWISIFTLPLSIHQATGVEPELAGNWRGIHSHKNEAGAFCAICVIVFLHETFRTRSYVTGPIFITMAIVFLYMTRSKTSMGFLPIAIFVGSGMPYMYKHGRQRTIILCSGVLLVLTSYAVWGSQIADQLATIVDDPTGFTGRVQIWPVLMQYVGDHFLLGAGYGSFWSIGPLSPILYYSSGWVTTINHAHNGYLNTLIQIGIMGTFQAILIFVLIPLYILLGMSLKQEYLRFMLSCLVIFTALVNLLESSMLDRANPIWLVMLIAYVLVHDGRALSPRVGSEAAR